MSECPGCGGEPAPKGHGAGIYCSPACASQHRTRQRVLEQVGEA